MIAFLRLLPHDRPANGSIRVAAVVLLAVVLVAELDTWRSRSRGGGARGGRRGRAHGWRGHAEGDFLTSTSSRKLGRSLCEFNRRCEFSKALTTRASNML